MGQAEIFHLTAIIFFGLCGLLTLVSAILYFSLHIGELIQETTGRAARRQIAEYEAKQAGLESERKYRNRQERLKEGMAAKKDVTVLPDTAAEDGTVLLGMPAEDGTMLLGESQDDGTTLLLGAQ